MSQLVLDDQLQLLKVVEPIRKWAKCLRLSDLRPGERILDERVPEVLRGLNKPTFITIDQDFWAPHNCHPSYCILHFALRDDQQYQLPGLLRALVRTTEFQKRAWRMGKVARVSPVSIDYYQFPKEDLHHLSWTGQGGRRRKR